MRGSGIATENVVVKVATATLIYTIGYVIYNACNILFWISIGHLMNYNMAGYYIGILVSILSTTVFLSTLGNIGYNYYLLKFVPKNKLKPFYTTLLISVMVMPLIYITSIFIARAIAEVNSYMWFVLLFTYSTIVGNITLYTALALHKPWIASMILSISALLKLFLSIMLLLLGFGFTGLIIALTASYLVLLFSPFILIFFCKEYISSLPGLADLKKALVFGIANYGQILSFNIIIAVPTLLARMFFNIPELSGAVYLSTLILVFATMVPYMIVSLSLSESVWEGVDSVVVSSKYSVALLHVISILLAIFSPIIIGIIVPAYVRYWYILFYILPVAPSLILMQTAVSRMNILERKNRLFITGVIRFVFMCVIFYLGVITGLPTSITLSLSMLLSNTLALMLTFDKEIIILFAKSLITTFSLLLPMYAVLNTPYFYMTSILASIGSLILVNYVIIKLKMFYLITMNTIKMLIRRS